MFQKAREKTYLESTSLLFLLVRWRKPLGIILAVALVGSFVFSGPAFIQPRYRSSVIFFPSATNSISKAILEESISEKQDILAFGEEEQAEQLLQILNSDEIRDGIVKKYDLINHYRIKSDEEYPLTRLYKKYRENINFARTEYMSVRIDVLDTDPQMAADIANDIAALLDSAKNKIQRSRAADALAIVQRTYEEKLAEMKGKEDSLRKLCDLGVMDFATQTEILNKEYTLAASLYASERASLPVLEKYKPENDTAVIGTKARINGAEARMAGLHRQLDNLSKFGGASVSLNQELKLDREELARIKKQLDKLSVDARQTLTPKFVVNNAVKAEKKSYPVRWLIVVVSLCVTFIFSVIVISVFEKVKEIKYNL
jgi:hypothetical protein